MAEMDKYFQLMAEHGTSDLHISTGSKPMFRKDGSIVPLKAAEVITAEKAEELLFEITPPKNLEEFKAVHDTDFAYALEGAGRFRANIFRDHRGVGGVFRLIPSEVLTFEQLNSPPSLKRFCSLHKGLVLVTGPTGSGKSTTLAAMIDFINKSRNDHIITVEDPIEFTHQNQRCLVNQRQVGEHTASFKSALRAALREDPDIVLVGEMRDLETTHIAIETAETGHLVFGTLHTTTAVSTVDRMIDQFPANQQQQIRTMLSATLKGVVAQNLLKKKGGGRVAALEILFVTPAVASLIREAKTSQIVSIMQTAKKEGMTLLNEELVRFVKEEVVEPMEAFSKAVDKEGLMKDFEHAGISLRPASE
jgi:twitching motility protein PilT